ncbi:MAG: methyl-accepting chemotaxis protein [Massilia sp.]
MCTPRQLDTRTKLLSCFALMLGLGLLLALWLLAQLAQMSELAAQAGAAAAKPLGAGARADYASVRNWSVLIMLVAAGAGAALALWLSGEVARPVHEAVGIARRVAEGDLSTKAGVIAHGDAGLLMRTMQEMNDKLVRMIVNVRSGSEIIASGAAEIASGSMDLSARTEQQAAALEETASSMEELTATVKQNADHAHQARLLAVSASEVAVKGGEVVSEVVGTMASIHDSSKRISEIIGVIDGIAFQTNILALNAAVEAARAGEQGRGFAVVASEVRNLAQRSAAAAKEIKALIDDSVEKVNAGTELADKAGNTMHEVVTSVKRVTDIIAEIADASAEQTTGIEQVNLAIAEMDQSTQQNAALVEESAAAAASMREQAGSLSRVIGAFVLGPEHARAAPAIHLVASNKGKREPARAPARAARVKPTAVRAVAVKTGAAAARQAGAAKPDLDWEEF